MPAKPAARRLRAVLWMGCAVLSSSRTWAPSRTATLRTRLLRFHFARAIMHLGGQFCWIYAIGALTLATVFAIEFTMPVWVALLAMLVLARNSGSGS